jgi:hypothetical protein
MICCCEQLSFTDHKTPTLFIVYHVHNYTYHTNCHGLNMLTNWMVLDYLLAIRLNFRLLTHMMRTRYSFSQYKLLPKKLPRCWMVHTLRNIRDKPQYSLTNGQSGPQHPRPRQSKINYPSIWYSFDRQLTRVNKQQGFTRGLDLRFPHLVAQPKIHLLIGDMESEIVPHKSIAFVNTAITALPVFFFRLCEVDEDPHIRVC